MMNRAKINFKQKAGWALVVALVLFPAFLYSQKPQVLTSVDKYNILIGEQLKLKITTTFPLHSPASNYLLSIPDSIPHFEIIDKGHADTVFYKDNSKAVEQTITFTSFDSGKWNIPSFKLINAFSTADQSSNLFSDSVAINVAYAPADSTNQLRDIKPVIEVYVPDYFWYYIAAAVVLTLLIGFLLIRILLKNPKQKPAPEFVSNISAYDEAVQELKKLKQFDLQKAVEVKLFHIKLCDIFKRYLSRKQNKNLSNKTTGDLLIIIKENVFSQADISKLATALRCSDAVKFAKYIPSVAESDDCLLKIKETIVLIENKSLNFKP